MKRILSAVIIFFVTFSLNNAAAQCKNFSKKKCMPSLAPYVTNGQVNTATFFPGDHAEIPLSFFENTSYRVMVCNQEILGKVAFKVLDAKKNTIFDNKGVGYAGAWDFKSVSNQSLTLVIDVPAMDDNHSGIQPSGCISVLIGFKKN